MDLVFDVDNQSLTRNDTVNNVVGGSHNYLNCVFNFNSDEWLGITKIAVFRDDKGKESCRYLNKLSRCECMVPASVLNGDFFTVGVYGGDLITTNVITVILASSVFDKCCNSDKKDIYIDLFEELDTKINKQELDMYYELVTEKVDKDCFDNFLIIV